MAIHAISKHVERVVIYRPHNVYGPDMGEEHVIPQFLRRLHNLNSKTNANKVLDFPIQGKGNET